VIDARQRVLTRVGCMPVLISERGNYMKLILTGAAMLALAIWGKRRRNLNPGMAWNDASGARPTSGSRPACFQDYRGAG
jgi:hypothetical protein